MDLPQGYPSGQSFNVPRVSRVSAANLALLYMSLRAPRDPFMPYSEWDKQFLSSIGVQP